jgi:hypothetical protein
MAKEKSDRQFTVMLKPSLFIAFEKACLNSHRTVSEVTRELLSKYSQGWHQMPPCVTITKNNTSNSDNT